MTTTAQHTNNADETKRYQQFRCEICHFQSGDILLIQTHLMLHEETYHSGLYMSGFIHESNDCDTWKVLDTITADELNLAARKAVILDNCQLNSMQNLPLHTTVTGETLQPLCEATKLSQDNDKGLEHENINLTRNLSGMTINDQGMMAEEQLIKTSLSNTP